MAEKFFQEEFPEGVLMGEGDYKQFFQSLAAEEEPSQRSLRKAEKLVEEAKAKKPKMSTIPAESEKEFLSFFPGFSVEDIAKLPPLHFEDDEEEEPKPAKKKRGRPRKK